MAGRSSDSGNGLRETVFVVDDDAAVCRALGRLFQATGRTVEAFTSPQAFLDRLPYDGAGCVVLDLQMPGISGTGVQALLTERNVGLPVVFLTGHGELPIAVRAMKEGAADFLLKPVNDEALLLVVDAAVARHALQRVREGGRQVVVAKLARLSVREGEVLREVIRGRLNKQIALDLDIALQTVKTHRSRVMEKMECRSVAELVRACELAETVVAGQAA
jgi:FixJ family two-component response regulator